LNQIGLNEDNTFIDLFANASGIKRSKYKNGKLIDGKVVQAMPM
jgi:hypothetical protein